MSRILIAAFVALLFTAVWLLAVGTLAIGVAHLGWPVPSNSSLVTCGLIVFGGVFAVAYKHSKGKA